MLWVEALHIVAVVSWFAGLFYLPRLFVYHADAKDSLSNERFKLMERKLFRGIMTPAMIATLGLGIWLLHLQDYMWLRSGWLHAKLTLVVLVVIYHHLCLMHMKRFARDANTHSHVYFRWFNEAPIVLLLGIVILVVVKPF